ncbi:uncharacterized protein LOC143295361 [Babylonia areolata]|uniref:uncharacterized protein LOC143295361 n=1 Tax=Babylonia areolata TaxID=304850 RepID=UPI003FD003E2
MLFTLTLLATLAVERGQAINYLPQFSQGYGGPVAGIQGYGQLGGYGGGYDSRNTNDRNVGLSCLMVVEDYGAVNGISVNINQKSRQTGYGGPSHFGFPAFESIFGRVKDGGGSGLNATVQLISSAKGEVSVILTERGFTDGHTCYKKNFGSGLSASRRTGGFPHGGGVYGGPGGGWAGGSLAAAGVGYGYGGDVASSLISPWLAPVGIGPVHHGFGHHPAAAQVGYNDGRRGDGVIAVQTVSGDQWITISLNSLDGYRDLSELAGRSAIVCTKAVVGYGGKADCTGDILACCSLAYDNKDRKLEYV